MEQPIKVSSEELRQILFHIQNPTLNICVRFRLLGQLWQTSFMRVILVIENGVVLHTDGENKLTVIKNLTEVVQFELDQPLFQYEPHFHYYHEPEGNN